MVCLPTGTMEGASCVLFYQLGRRSRHPRAPSTGKASILSCEFLLFSRTNSRALGKVCVWSVAVGELEGRPVIVSGGWNGTVRVWGESGQLKMTVSVDATAEAIALAPGERIVVGTLEGLMVLKWNPIAHSPSMPRSIVQRPEP